MSERKRYEGLDQLRGILAFIVMCYHYLSWQNITISWCIQRPLDLLGLYAVATFYALSGCALYIVYRSSIINLSFIKEFWMKRSLRILPLFWLITTLTIPTILMKGESVSGRELWLNYTMLFSWMEPSAYIASAAWSIGNEWVFYMLFPFLLWALKAKINFTIVISLVALAGGWFWFNALDSALSVAEQWKTYVSPLNQFPLFVGGFTVGKFVLNPHNNKSLNWGLLFLSTALFIFLSYRMSQADSIHGVARIIFALISITWCYCFGVLDIISSARVAKVLTWLGSISYTVYLVHPLVIRSMQFVLGEKGKVNTMLGLSEDSLARLIVVGSIVATLLSSHYIYKFVEIPAIKLGKKISKRKRLLNNEGS